MSRGPPGRWRWVHRRMHDAQPVGTRIPGQPLERGPGGLRQILPQATPTVPKAMTAPVDHVSPSDHGPVPVPGQRRRTGDAGRVGGWGGTL